MDRVVDALVRPPQLQPPRPVREAPRTRRARAPSNGTRTALPQTPAPDTSAASWAPYMAQGAQRRLAQSLTFRGYPDFGSGAHSNQRPSKRGFPSQTASVSHHLRLHVS